MPITTILTIIVLLIIAICIIVKMVKEIKAAWGKGTEVPLYFPKDDGWFEEFTSYLIAVTEQQIDEEHIQSKFEIYILYIAARMKMDRYEAAEFLLEVVQEYNNIDLSNKGE